MKMICYRKSTPDCSGYPAGTRYECRGVIAKSGTKAEQCTSVYVQTFENQDNYTFKTVSIKQKDNNL
jgi:hypothetical protein